VCLIPALLSFKATVVALLVQHSSRFVNALCESGGT